MKNLFRLVLSLAPGLATGLAPVLALCLAALALPVTAQAQTPASVGTVQFSAGPAVIVRGTQTIDAVKNTPLLPGDLVRTPVGATVQLAMVDGAFISVRPATEMRIARYEFDTAKPGAGEALLELVRGTMRTFTGELARLNRDKFKMSTHIATLGIRGSGNVLSHDEQNGTYNHTLTGAHSVTSVDAGGNERTLVSLPGQTIQVLPGMAPRFVPTPAFILANATPAAKQAAGDSDKKSTSDGTQTASVNEAPPTSTTASATSATTSATTTAAQAATAALVTTIAAVQLPATQSFVFGARSERPLSGGGYEGIFPQAGIAGANLQLNAAGAVTQVSNSTFATFLSSPAIAYPNGYTPVTVNSATVAFNGGTFSDGFRSTDGSILLGRWTGGSMDVTPTGQNTATSYALGPRSVSYSAYSPTPFSTVTAFTGTTSYALAASTAPTDAAGNVGQLTSASVSLNFSSLTAILAAALNINSQNLTLAGSTAFGRGDATIVWSQRPNSSSNTMTVTCTGSGCNARGYESIVNAGFAGSAGDWLSLNYRLVPNRVSGGAYDDVISGYAALRAATAPTIGIVLPQTGTASLSFANFIDVGSTFAGNAVITGSLQANFSTKVASFNATVGASGSPTFNATSSNMPITGNAFSASTTPATGIGTMTVTCTAGCSTQSATIGRFDGFFTNSSGSAGQGTILVGNASGSYTGVTSLITPLNATAIAADLRSPSSAALGITSATTGGITVTRLAKMHDILGGNY